MKEMWADSILGEPEPGERSAEPGELLRRWDHASARWRDAVREVRDRGRWNDAVIDVSCDPPETFVLGAAILHVFTQHGLSPRPRGWGALAPSRFRP